MSAMRITAYGTTDVGRRRTQNQDNVLCYTPRSGSTPAGLYAVADGMGGQSGGEIASQIAIDTIREDLEQVLDQSIGIADGSQVVTGRLHEEELAVEVPSNLSLVDALTGAIRRSNQRIRDHGQV